MKIKHGHGERVQFSLRITPYIRKRLAKLAQEQDVSINELIVGWIDEKLRKKTS